VRLWLVGAILAGILSQGSLTEAPHPPWIGRNCLRWRTLIDRWNPDFRLNEAMVMAVMAQESHCLANPPDTLSYDGNLSVGLMQVVPRSWTPGDLTDPATNTYWGMFILASSLRQAHGDWHLALSLYNSGGDTPAGRKYAELVLVWYRELWPLWKFYYGNR
jgi:soluble lytic murein transglycosylase-like protein